ncbi:MAG: glycosyltransferase family 2 protein [Candidatus Sumerlaeia bacterium]
MLPKISVIIPTHNDAEFLRESIPSVLEHGRDIPLEILVIDDGSEPSAESFYNPRDPRVTFHYQKAKGVSAARNRGMHLAVGEYIVFLDADDHMLPERLTRQLRVLDENPEVGLVGGDITRRSQTGLEESWGIFEAFGAEIPNHELGDDCYIFEEKFRDLLLFHYPFNTSVMTVRRQAVGKEIQFDPELICWEDWDFVVRIARKWKIGYVKRPVCMYRKRPGSITTTADPRKFLSRAAMFGKWLDDFKQLTPEQRRHLEKQENDAWLAASYEFRATDRLCALKCAGHALRQMPRWKAFRSMLGSMISPASARAMF